MLSKAHLQNFYVGNNLEANVSVYIVQYVWLKFKAGILLIYLPFGLDLVFQISSNP